MKDNNYIVIQGWMINRLELKGNELVAYALIYGFSQDGVCSFDGSLAYIASVLNVTRANTHSIVARLVEKGYIIKTDRIINGVKFCSYSANMQYVPNTSTQNDNTITETVTGCYQNNNGGVTETITGGVTETIPNNTIIDNNIDNINNNSCCSSVRVRDFKSILLDSKSKYWQDAICMKHHIDINKLLLKVDEFVTSCIARGDETHDTPQEIKRHFDSWLTITLNQERKEQKQSEHYMTAQERKNADIEEGIRKYYEVKKRLEENNY